MPRRYLVWVIVMVTSIGVLINVLKFYLHLRMPIAAYDPRGRYLAFAASIAPVPCREDLAKLAETKFKYTGNAAEIGVHRGDFAERNLRAWSGEYFAVDMWKKSYSLPQLSEPFTEHYHEAKFKLDPFGPRAHMIRSDSVTAARNFKDGYFDWIYLDAGKAPDQVMADLRAWWPKLRPGGLFSGDDYGDYRETPFLHVNRTMVYYHDAWKYKWGVALSV